MPILICSSNRAGAESSNSPDSAGAVPKGAACCVFSGAQQERLKDSCDCMLTYHKFGYRDTQIEDSAFHITSTSISAVAQVVTQFMP